MRNVGGSDIYILGREREEAGEKDVHRLINHIKSWTKIQRLQRVHLTFKTIGICYHLNGFGFPEFLEGRKTYCLFHFL